MEPLHGELGREAVGRSGLYRHCAHGWKDVVFPTNLVDMTEGRDMVFRGAPKKGLISDDHYFNLTALEGGRTHFSQRVAFAGIMSPFIGRVVADTGKAIEAMNHAYKARCEGK